MKEREKKKESVSQSVSLDILLLINPVEPKKGPGYYYYYVLLLSERASERPSSTFGNNGN